MNTNSNTSRFLAGCAAILLLAGAAIGPSPPSPQVRTIKEIESFLAQARVVSVEKDIETGRTMPWRVTLDDGRTKARALFKYVDRTTMQPPRHSYRYELAAYTLNRLLDLEIVPPVIEREIEQTSGSLQWYLEGCLSERDRERLKKNPPDLEAFLRRLAVVQILEALTNDECGDKDDTLIHADTWKICRIDFSGAFRPAKSLPLGHSIESCSRTLFHRLDGLSRSVIAGRLRPYLNDDEIDALYRRKLEILRILKTAIREKGESAVLFDVNNPEP